MPTEGRESDHRQPIVQTPMEKLEAVGKLALPPQLHAERVRGLFATANFYLGSWQLQGELASYDLVRLIGCVNAQEVQLSEYDWEGICFLAVTASCSNAALRSYKLKRVHSLVYRAIRELTGKRRLNAARYALAGFAGIGLTAAFWRIWLAYVGNCTEMERQLLWRQEILFSGMHKSPPRIPSLAARVVDSLTASEREESDGFWNVHIESLA